MLQLSAAISMPLFPVKMRPGNIFIMQPPTHLGKALWTAHARTLDNHWLLLFMHVWFFLQFFLSYMANLLCYHFVLHVQCFTHSVRIIPHEPITQAFNQNGIFNAKIFLLVLSVNFPMYCFTKKQKNSKANCYF